MTSTGSLPENTEPESVASLDPAAQPAPTSPAETEAQTTATAASDVSGPLPERTLQPIEQKSPERPGPTAPTPRKPWWQRAWGIFAAVIAIIGAVTGVISILPVVLRNSTDAESLSVSVRLAESELVSTFAIPATVDWSTLPDSTGACSEEQFTWLQDVGTKLDERYLVSVANSASEGATLSLKDFRGQGEASTSPPTAIAVVCDRSGSGSSSLRAAIVDPASSRTAVYEQADKTLPDNPLVFNLAPGESGEFALLIHSSADFEGELVFTSALGGQTWTVVLPMDGIVSAPGVAEQRLNIVDGSLTCVGLADCDPVQVIGDVLAASGVT